MDAKGVSAGWECPNRNEGAGSRACAYRPIPRWEYHLEITVKHSEAPWAVLEFAGIDTVATITLNDDLIGTTGNMFIPQSFDVSQFLVEGRNTLMVSFVPVQEIIKGKSLDYQNAFDKPERVHIRRMQCTFHWDWVNRFVSYGIWRTACIQLIDRARLVDLWVRTPVVESGAAQIEVTAEWETKGRYPLVLDLEISDPSGTAIDSYSERIGDGSTVTRRIRIDSPLLHRLLVRRFRASTCPKTAGHK